MANDTVRNLLEQSGIGVVATVQQLGAATMADIPVDDHTAVVLVDQVLHAPEPFGRLVGSHMTIQLAEDHGLPAVGDQLAFFANALAFGETLAVTEVGRLPIEDITPHLGATAAPTGEQPIADLQTEIEADRVGQHVRAADAIVIGVVTALAKAGEPAWSEHDPDWWTATLDVHHVERGSVAEGPLTVAYPNSHDVRWRHSPKPTAGQNGVWILHATEGALADIAPFYLVHPDDVQSVQALGAIRERVLPA